MTILNVSTTPSWVESLDRQGPLMKQFLARNGDRRKGLRPFNVFNNPGTELADRPQGQEWYQLVAMLDKRGATPGFQHTADAISSMLGVAHSLDIHGLQLAPYADYAPGTSVGVYNPSAYKGKTYEEALHLSFLDGTPLASGLVPMLALYSNDEYLNGLGKEFPFPHLSGTLLSSPHAFTLPYLTYDEAGELVVRGHNYDEAVEDACWPTFVEC